jgi:hypothetical protein
MRRFDTLISTFRGETPEEARWEGMDADLARLVVRAYSQGVQDVLESLPELAHGRRTVVESALLDVAQAWGSGKERTV